MCIRDSQRAAKESVKGSNERLVEQLTPGLEVVRSITTATAQMHLSVVTRIPVGNHFELGARGCRVTRKNMRWAYNVA